MQDAGLVVRARSEGDRRRSYLRLVPEVVDSLNSPPAGLRPARRVVFVCTANSARSQLAAALWQQASVVPAVSAGTHPAAKIHPGAVATARRHGLPLPATVPRQLTDVLVDADFVITVCDSAHEELGELEPVHWSVPDPVPAANAAAFDAAFDEIARRVQQVSPQLTTAAPALPTPYRGGLR
jgi:protein-tyrosine-phosphatase